MIVTRKPRSTYPDLSFAPLELRGCERTPVTEPYRLDKPRGSAMRTVLGLVVVVLICGLTRCVVPA